MCIGDGEVDTHHCSGLTPHPEIGPDAFSCTGLPGNLAFILLSHEQSEEWRHAATIHISVCKCAVKTMIVPAYQIGPWQDSHRDSAFGASSATRCGPYIGSAVHTRTDGAPTALVLGTWHRDAAEAARIACWKKPLAAM